MQNMTFLTVITSIGTTILEVHIYSCFIVMYSLVGWPNYESSDPSKNASI